MVGLSEGEKHFIRGGIAQDLRTDGRRRLQFRAISVETGVIPQANGSARVRLGATEVIATVKAELGKPSILHPDKGKVSIFVDCSPTAAPMFEGRGSEEFSAELCVALQRCLLGGKSGAVIKAVWRAKALHTRLNAIAPLPHEKTKRRKEEGNRSQAKQWMEQRRCQRGGAAIDLSSLIVVDGKVCWDLYIDGLVVSSDGNLLDALAAAIKVALSDTGIPKVNVSLSATTDEEPEVNVSDEEFLQFDTSSVPVIVTLTKVGKHYIVDATSEEESQMSSAVSVSVNRHGQIRGLTKRGGAGLDPSVIFDMISVAKHVSRQFISVLDSEILAAEAAE
uniref:Ribosomal RNA-processing protein 42 n=1 Tax=Oryza meridionalis TaxID=40149 RepID=A0A0E0FBH1_9ORYZ